jgi:hypothetical protein
MIERADFDLDGLVSEEEFYNLLTKKAYWLIGVWFRSTLIVLNLINLFFEVKRAMLLNLMKCNMNEKIFKLNW